MGLISIFMAVMRIRASYMIAVVLILLVSCSIDRSPRHKPNLVFVFVDQMSLESLGFMNEYPVITSRIDQFSFESQYFTNAISNVPASSVFRGMLMTGRYPLTTGITTNIYPAHNYGLSVSERSFGVVLKDAGYQTAFIGLWHLENPEMIPIAYELENHVKRNEFIDGPGQHGFDYVLQAFRSSGQTEAVYLDGNRQVFKTTRPVDFKTAKAIEFIRNRKQNKPFALFVSHGLPNAHFAVPNTYRNLYRDADMGLWPDQNDCETTGNLLSGFARISWFDDNFGKLLDALHAEGLDEQTIVVFTSSFGEMSGIHGVNKENAFWYNECIKIPFLLRWQGKVPAGRNEMLFAAHDFMPTLLGMMHVKIPEKVEGVDWSSHIFEKNSNGPSSAFIAHYPYMAYDMPWVNVMPRHIVINQGLERRNHGYHDLSQIGFRGVTTGKYTYVIDRCPEEEPGISLNWWKWDSEMKYNREGLTRVSEFFYDNETDPMQLNPVPLSSESYRDAINHHRKELQMWLKKTHDPFVPVDLE